jgi:hypothetical protein
MINRDGYQFHSDRFMYLRFAGEKAEEQSGHSLLGIWKSQVITHLTGNFRIHKSQR